MQKISNKQDNLISIVVINYNDKNGLAITLQSIKKQNMNCYEVIFVDGGSTDGSLEVSNSYSYLFSDILVGQDTGIYDAMNLGIKKSSGRYLLFLNSGDYLLGSDVLDVVSAKISSVSNDPLIFGYAEIVSDKSKWLWPPPKKSENPVSLKKWVTYHEPNHQSMFFPRQYCIENFFDERLAIISDRKFKRGALYKLDYYFINRSIVTFSLGGVSSSISDFNHLKKYFKDFKQYYLPDGPTLKGLFLMIKADLKVTIKYLLQKLLSTKFWKLMSLFKAINQ